MPERAGLYYTDQGKGDPVVFIHGFCETHVIWDSLTTRLSGHYRILSIDLPGFGKSVFPPTPFSINDIASKVLAWLDEIKIERCVLIGHSLGGYVALAMIAQQAHRFHACCLFHSTAYADTDERRASRDKVVEFVRKNGVRSFIESFIPPLFYDQSNSHIQPVVALASQTPEEVLIGYVQAMRDRPERIDILKSFPRPMLFIAGEKDAGIPFEMLQKQANVMQQATFCLMPEVAHMGMFENEGVSVRQIQRFLDSLGAAGIA